MASAVDTFGTQHVGLDLPDIKWAIRSPEVVFDAVSRFCAWRQHINVTHAAHKKDAPSDACIGDIKVLRPGTDTGPALLEYDGEAQLNPARCNGEVGGWHVTFQAADADTAVDLLGAADIDVINELAYVEEEPGADITQVYLGTPRNQLLELVSITDRLGHDQRVTKAMVIPTVNFKVSQEARQALAEIRQGRNTRMLWPTGRTDHCTLPPKSTGGSKQ
ncbi:MAG: hypothetical protein KDK89_11915 [Alphaproteobacteria bacterium]|nr:hypothetical protein [Alphaproteobacteria bacterium]